MRRRVVRAIRAGLAAAAALAGAAEARAQLPTLSIADARVVEGSAGSWDLDLTVTLSASSTSTVSAAWTTVNGSASSGSDFTSRSGSVVFPPGSTTQTLSVPVIGDTAIEWSPTLQMDEAFFVQMASASNGTFLKSRATATIVDDDRALPGLQLVSAVADGSATEGRVRLQWRVPPSYASGDPVDVRVRWNEGSACAAPANVSDSVTGEFLLSSPPLPTLAATVKAPGEAQVFEHLGRPLVKHCYALFAIYSPGGPTTERAVVSATPFDSTPPNPLAWAYSTGGAAPDYSAPTVGTDAVYIVSLDGVVHAMTRDETGGTWPSSWNPVALGQPIHNRMPVVPLPFGQRLFVGTESGEVHAVDGVNGSIAWSRSATFGGTQLPNVGGAQGTPAGLFTSWGGLNDAVLVGTNLTSGNTVFMLNPVTGGALDSHNHGSLGGVRGMPVVDYAGNRAHVVTTLPSGALWTLDLGAAGVPALVPSALAGANPLSLTYGSNSSPVLRNGRLYYGLTNGDVKVYQISDAKEATLGGGTELKAFAFPDRRNGDFYFSTNTWVWGVRDTLSGNPSLIPRWTVQDIPTPSPVLHWPNTDHLYVGGGDGRLYQIDVSAATPQTTKKSVLLEAGEQIGAPSLDGPNGLVLVGSATGVVYAVRVPLP
jgi:hypothetical protein